MSSSRPPAGMFDLVGVAAERHERVSDQLRAAFRRYGYQPVIPPVVERAEHFLDRTGEDIRSRMYLFTDPGGREVCLRPELTIPTVRLYADQFKGDGRLFRGYYIGPVFRYDTRSEGRYRQFTQAGAELIGETDIDLADAEILAAAYHALDSCGPLGALHLAVSDISFFTSLIGAEPGVSEKLASRLRALATDPHKLSDYLDRSDSGDASQGLAGPNPGGLDFLSSLTSVAPEDRRELVSGIVRSLQGTEPFGSRTIEDITERTLAVADAADRNRLPERLSGGLRQLLDVRVPMPAGLDAIAEVARTTGAEPLAAVVAGWRRKSELFEAFGLDPAAITLDLRVGRGIDYYSSFVFEITTGSGPSRDQLCAGGRYDDLVQFLGGRNPVPAVGFAIGVERVLLALAAPDQVPSLPAAARETDHGDGAEGNGDNSNGGEPALAVSADVIVVGGGEVSEADVVRAASRLRHGGLRAVHLTGHRVRYGLTQALKNGVPYLAVVGAQESAQGLVTLRHLATHSEQSVPLDQAASTVAAGLAAAGRAEAGPEGGLNRSTGPEVGP